MPVPVNEMLQYVWSGGLSVLSAEEYLYQQTKYRRFDPELTCFTIWSTVYLSGTVASKAPCMVFSACLYSVETRLERVLPGDDDRFRFCPETSEASFAEIVPGIPSSSIVTLCDVEQMTG